jgi:hypothetical protein
MIPENQEIPAISPAQDPDFDSRHLPGIAAGESKGMLPGMALIGMYLLVLSMLNAFAAMRGTFGVGAAKYSILGVCTLLVIGIFGMLRLRRWGWSADGSRLLLRLPPDARPTVHHQRSFRPGFLPLP